MPFKTRFTKKGKQNQAADELEGWKMLVAECQGSPSHTEVDNLSEKNDTNQITGWDKGDDDYAKWKEAHKRYTKKARSERQRRQKAEAAGPVNEGEPVQPCQVEPDLNVRDSLRVAILKQQTSTDGTKLNKNRARTHSQLLAHLKSRLTKVDDELDIRSRHKEAHDLRIQGRPPKRVFVAAEWFFRPPDRPYTSAEKNEIIRELKSISRTFPGWLLVPGTIYWSHTNPNNPPLHVFNQAVVFSAGSERFTRTKNDNHDISRPAQEIWGRDHLDPNHLPAGVNQASLDPPARWNHKNLEWSLDICRDHYVGEGIGGYAQNHAGSPGANVYIVIASEVIIADHFIAARNNGFFIICDGGTSAYNVYKITRNNLNTITPQITGYRANEANFIQQDRTQRDLIKQYETEKTNLKQNEHYKTFIERYSDLIKEDSSDPHVKNTIVTSFPADNFGNVNDSIKADRFEDLLNNHPNFGNTAITVEEQNIVQQHIQAVRNRANAITTKTNLGQTNHNAKQTFITASNVNKTNINALEARAPNDVKLYQLIDL